MVKTEELRQLATLARLQFEGEEERIISGNLVRIIDYVRRLEEVEVEGVEPLYHVHDLENVMEEDSPRESIHVSEILSQAPSIKDSCLQFPRLFGESGEND